MSESTEVQHSAFPRAEPRGAEIALSGAGEKIKSVVARSVLWSYERGSWQYDIICLVILAFIFLSPRSWFSDRPTLQLTALRNNQGLVEVGRVKNEWHYLVDARLVESLKPEKPEDAAHEILRRRLQKPFTIKSLEVVRDKNNVVLGYMVIVTR